MYVVEMLKRKIDETFGDWDCWWMFEDKMDEIFEDIDIWDFLEGRCPICGRSLSEYCSTIWCESCKLSFSLDVEKEGRVVEKGEQ
jgi:hypothetical protein